LGNLYRSITNIDIQHLIKSHGIERCRRRNLPSRRAMRRRSIYCEALDSGVESEKWVHAFNREV
jgi:hypothetical protein